MLDCTLKGVRRLKGDSVVHKQPVTPSLLRQLHGILQFNNPLHACVWSAALTMFFALLRRSSVLPAQRRRDPGADCVCFLRRDVQFHPWGMMLVLRRTKTIQFKERSLQIPIPAKAGSILCPVQALFYAMQLNTSVPDTGYLYVLPNGQPVTIADFVTQFRHCLTTLGLPASQYCGHSFRRGGASWAFNVGVDVETIRQLGDWRSSAYTRYIHAHTSTMLKAIQQMQETC